MQFAERWKERLEPYLDGLTRLLDPAEHAGLYILVEDQESGLQTAWLPVSEILREGGNNQGIAFRTSLLRSITDLLESFDARTTRIINVEWQ